MLGKLTKYEFISTARHFLPLYAAIIILSFINRIFVLSDFATSTLNFVTSTIVGKFMSFILMGLFFAMIVALGVITLIVIIQRFYKNLYGDQGYLMHTLPVHKWELLFSKTVAAVVWIIISGIVVMASILILFSNFSVFKDIYMLNKELIEYFGFLPLFETIIMGLVTCASTVLNIYAAISVGHMFNSHKILLSFGAYIGFSIIESNLIFIGLNILDLIFNTFDAFLPTDIEALIINSPKTFIALIIAFELITGAIYFFVSHIIMTKKLNLQ